MFFSGRGAAWLARLLGVQEVPSSNLGGPTKFLKDLQAPTLPGPPFWCPIGVQTWTPAAAARITAKKLLKIPSTPSPSQKTRHSRHFRPKQLILFAEPVSDSSRKPDTDPTLSAKNPTPGVRMEPKRHIASHNSHNPQNSRPGPS